MIRWRWYNGLRFQIIVLLTVALLPLGAIAVYQTQSVEERARQDAELALLGLTARAVKSEELILERATGVVKFFALTAESFVANPERCRDQLSRFTRDNPFYSFIGIIPQSGTVTCSSFDRDLDISGWPDFDETLAREKPTLVLNTEGPASGTSVFVLSEPFFVNDTFGGFVSLSIPHDKLPKPKENLTEEGLIDLLTFNAQGDILLARNMSEVDVAELPRDTPLPQLRMAGSSVFSAENLNGAPRIYTVVPIAGTPATALGIWRADGALTQTRTEKISPAIFPVLMWFASMAVAILSIHTLVLRHLSQLRRKMDRFSADRSIACVQGNKMPYELQALTGNFNRLTDDILREEARLEDTLREKNVLIKEVHHRVKNNLQLIASIMNMQIRNARHKETKTVLSRVQDRVLSLATIHRNLYTSQDGGRVNARDLVMEIVQKSIEVGVPSPQGIETDLRIDAVLLYPDQAVPLSLLTAEAMTSAMRNLSTAMGEKPTIRVVLGQVDRTCTLTIENSMGVEVHKEDEGLGPQLMNAFALQLGGTVTTRRDVDLYRFVVTFDAEEFEPEMRDF